MHNKILTLFLSAAMMLTGCDKENSKEAPAITVTNQEHLTQNVYADENTGKNEVTFTTNSAWTSEIMESTKTKSIPTTTDWVSISPSRGDKAGNYTVKISLVTNFTGEKRTAVINIKCSGQTIAITVVQEATTVNGEKPIITNPVSFIELSPREVNLLPDETTALKAVVYPENASIKELNWNSSNPRVANVDNFGNVTALSEGTAIITVSSVASPEITATCAVIVNNTSETHIPSHYVRGINGVDMVFDAKTAYVIGNKTEMFVESYNIEGGTLGGGGPLKSIKGQGRDMRDPSEHEYVIENGYLKQLKSLIGSQGDYNSVIGEAVFTWEGENLMFIRDKDNKHSEAMLIEFEYSELVHPESNLDINLYAAFRDYNILGPHYYVIFDNNLGKYSKHLISKVIIHMENTPDYGGNYERTFRYVFNGKQVKEIYYTETKNGITKDETKLCDFYYR